MTAPRDLWERATVEAYAEVLGLERVGLQDDFFSSGGHSLLAVRLSEAIRERTGVQPPILDLFRHPTPEGLAASLRGGLSRAALDGVSCLQPGAPGRTPLVLAPAAGGHAVPYLPLVEALPSRIPVVVPELRGPVPATFEELAARLLARLADQGIVPEILLGWSYGGVLAFEMARQLGSKGRPPRILVLVDSEVPQAGALSEEAARDAFFEGPFATGEDASLPDELSAFLDTLYLLRSYTPLCYLGDMLYIRSDETFTRRPEVLEGWRRYVAGELAVWDLPGDHYSLLRLPRVRDLALELTRLVDARDGGA